MARNTFKKIALITLLSLTTFGGYEFSDVARRDECEREKHNSGDFFHSPDIEAINAKYAPGSARDIAYKGMFSLAGLLIGGGIAAMYHFRRKEKNIPRSSEDDEEEGDGRTPPMSHYRSGY